MASDGLDPSVSMATWPEMTSIDRQNLAALFTIAWHERVFFVDGKSERISDLYSLVEVTPSFDVKLRHVRSHDEVTVPATKLRKAGP